VHTRIVTSRRGATGDGFVRTRRRCSEGWRRSGLTRLGRRSAKGGRRTPAQPS
jgi:hypothetical protein